MPLGPAITDVAQLTVHPALARILAWKPAAVEAARYDRDELTLSIERSFIRDVCALLRDQAKCPFNFLSDLTCVDWYPSEPRFEVIYQLLSIPNRERVRLKVRLNGSRDRKSTRLNSSHTVISYAVFCLKKKKQTDEY